MKIPFSIPEPEGTERAEQSRAFRHLAAEVERLRPHALTLGNREEEDFRSTYASSFTKGLQHNPDSGLVDEVEHYRAFVEAINSPDPNLFAKLNRPTGDDFKCTSNDKDIRWRGWESPRSGHVFDLEGPDAGAVGMAPAPRVASNELAVEMAEVYALALVRDVPFDQWGKNKEVARWTKAIGKMDFFENKSLDRFERDRRDARLDDDGELTSEVNFRGSTPGAKAGPYISQFMLIGNVPRGSSNSSLIADGEISYGAQVIPQKQFAQERCVDYMTDWSSWLDVQNGADLRGLDLFEAKRKFITTPRDLATYVHFDALYQAYLNAALILLGMGAATSKGFPEKSLTENRDAFATFGGPHILSLVTEIASRCLKAVRRQKFNYHRRARPETLGGRLTLLESNCSDLLGDSKAAFEALLKELPKSLKDAVRDHNVAQNKVKHRRFKCGKAPKHIKPKELLLLPMAFPEGSPMHPAYGAGHATVAGGCVTVLKAFFEMFQDNDSTQERLLFPDSPKLAYVSNSSKDGQTLAKVNQKQPLTIQGELDKLAANISIGRNMAGVHYYSDYYDSLRMGERVAVGMLMEQSPTYGEAVEMTFTSFDGDRVSLVGQGGAAPNLAVIDREGNPVSSRDWWLRHVVGEQVILDR